MPGSYRLRPRALVDISHIDLTQTVLGHRVTMPIGVAPTAFQKLAHPDGECATARGKNKECYCWCTYEEHFLNQKTSCKMLYVV